MRFIFFFLVLISLALPAFSTERGAYHHYLAFEGDFIFWKREKSLSKSLVKSAGAPATLNESSKCAKEPDKTLIQSRQLVHDMHFDPGLRISAKLLYSINSTWVLSYTGMLNWEGKEQLHCLHNLNLPGQLGLHSFDYHNADQAKASYRSDFYTIDLTYWRHVTPRYVNQFSVSWMIGLRFIDLDEKLKLYFTKGLNTSCYRIKTFNRSFGPFFGGDIEYNPYHFLTWALAGNVGALVNRGRQNSLMLDLNNTFVVRDTDPSRTNFAYFIDLFPFLEFRFVKFFTFRIGYELLYIGRVALADHQLFYDETGSHLNHNGGIMYHGLFAGIQFNF